MNSVPIRQETEAAKERRLVFSNLCNGVPISDIGVAFKKSEKEIMSIFNFVSLKIRSYGFQRGMPYFPCDTIELCIKNQLAVFNVLDKLNLDSDPAFKKVETQPWRVIND